MTLKAVTDVENTFLTPWPLILYCIVSSFRFDFFFLLIFMTSIPTFALRGFSENQYGGYMGTTSQQVTNLTLKVYEKQLELVGNLSYQGKFQ